MKPSCPIGRSTSHGDHPTRHLNAFRGVRAISEFDWPFTPTHTPHPEAFQRLSVRTSIPCYRDFILDMCRSLGFASATANYTPYSGSPSLRMRVSWHLSSLATATRRLIMQKARRHTHSVLRPLVGAWVQVLFHSHTMGAFHLSLTVLVHYRSHGSI